MKDKVVISLTGHRPDKLAGYNLNQPYYHKLKSKLVAIIESALEKSRFVECHSGMALGADTVWSMAILECKDKYPDRIKFVAEIPDYNQPSRWIGKEDRERWQEHIDRAEEINTYNQNDGKSYAYVLNQRNIGMISACDILIAIYNGDKTGGTANGVKDGVRLNKHIVTIHPDLFR